MGLKEANEATLNTEADSQPVDPLTLLEQTVIQLGATVARLTGETIVYSADQSGYSEPGVKTPIVVDKLPTGTRTVRVSRAVKSSLEFRRQLESYHAPGQKLNCSNLR